MGDAAITSITYSEDAASPFFAVVELGPNDANISRLDVYRGADGRLSSVVAYGPEDRPAVITFDVEGRPVRVDASGYVADFTYPAADVEVVITAPDGSVVRNRGPLDLGASVPARRTPNARLASFMEEPPQPGMVRWPAAFHSYSVFQLEVVNAGTNPGPWQRHVQFPDVGCRPDSGMDCAAGIFGSLSSLKPTTKLYVASYASAMDEPGSNDWVWRTRADCDAYAPLAEQVLSGAGGFIFAGGGIYKVVLGAAANPWITTPLLLVSAAIKGWQWLGPSSKPDCGSVPNLQKAEDEFFDKRSQKTATLTVTASGDCVTSPTSGWRIKEPTTQTVTFEPFSPVYRSTFGAVPGSDRPDGQPVPRGAITQIDDLPVVGTITFQATDCALGMVGTFDEASVTPVAPGSDVPTFLVSENTIALELKKADPATTTPIDVTGTFTLTYGAKAKVEGYDDCFLTFKMTGTLEGKLTVGPLTGAKKYGANGFATISMTTSLFGCPADATKAAKAAKPAILRNVKWEASGEDDTSLRGVIELVPPTREATWSVIFTVKKQP